MKIMLIMVRHAYVKLSSVTSVIFVAIKSFSGLKTN